MLRRSAQRRISGKEVLEDYVNREFKVNLNTVRASKRGFSTRFDTLCFVIVTCFCFDSACMCLRLDENTEMNESITAMPRVLIGFVFCELVTP